MAERWIGREGLGNSRACRVREKATQWGRGGSESDALGAGLQQGRARATPYLTRHHEQWHVPSANLRCPTPVTN